MELMGQWAPGGPEATRARQEGPRRRPRLVPLPGRRPAAPALPTDGFGGGNGIAVGKDAPPEADRLPEVLHRASTTRTSSTPTTSASRPPSGPSASVTDPNLQAVLEGRGKAKFVQLYLDQATAPAPGAAINDATWRCSPARRPPRRCARRSPTPRPPSRSNLRVSARRLTATSGPAPAGPLDSTARLRTPMTALSARQRGTAAAVDRSTWLTIALFLLPALALYVLFVLVPDRPGGPLQPVQVERPQAAHRLRRPEELPGRPGDPRVPGRRSATTC